MGGAKAVKEKGRKTNRGEQTSKTTNVLRESSTRRVDRRDALQAPFSMIDKQITEICSQSSQLGRRSSADKEVGALKDKLSVARTTLEGSGDIIPNPLPAVGVDPLEAAYKACRERENELLNTLLSMGKSVRDYVVVPLKQVAVHRTELAWTALLATLDAVEGQIRKASGESI